MLLDVFERYLTVAVKYLSLTMVWKMDRILDVPIFLEFYSGLLTERQAEIISLYCDEDYSLVEIAENLQISRQAVHDSIKSGLAALEEFEEKMGLVSKYKSRREVGETLIEMLTKAEFSGLSRHNEEILRLVIDKIREFIDM